LDKQALYLVKFLDKQDKSLKLLDKHYHRLLSLDEHYHRLLTGVINRYHHLMNMTYIWRIFNIIVKQVDISGDPD